MKYIKKLIVKNWLNYLYVAGYITNDEHAEMMKLTKYVGLNVSRQHKNLIPRQ